MANLSPTRTPMPEQDPLVRAGNFDEVAQGYTFEMAQEYQKARGKWIQKRNWHDMTMVINIEIGA